MKSLIILVFLMSTNLVFGNALDCTVVASENVLSRAVADLGVPRDDLRIRHIGQEDMDGGGPSGDVFHSQYFQYFDIFYVNQNREELSALKLYSIIVDEYSKADNRDEILGCDMRELYDEDPTDWDEIYDMYLSVS